jgi:hypothetical protein
MNDEANATGLDFEPFGGVKVVDRKIPAVGDKEPHRDVPPLVKMLCPSRPNNEP